MVAVAVPPHVVERALAAVVALARGVAPSRGSLASPSPRRRSVSARRQSARRWPSSARHLPRDTRFSPRLRHFRSRNSAPNRPRYSDRPRGFSRLGFNWHLDTYFLCLDYDLFLYTSGSITDPLSFQISMRDMNGLCMKGLLHGCLGALAPYMTLVHMGGNLVYLFETCFCGRLTGGNTFGGWRTRGRDRRWLVEWYGVDNR